MGNLFDIALILAFAASVFFCYKLGFFKLIRPFRKLAAFVLAWSLKDSAIVRGTVGKLINADGFKAFLNGRVNALWGERIKTAASADGVSISERFDNVFGFLGEIFANIKSFCIALYDKELSASIPNDTVPFSEKLEAFVMEVTDYITGAAVGFLTALSGFILLYIIFSVSFWLIAKLLDGIFSDGVFGLLNRCIGGAVGILYGFLIAWALSLAFVLLIPLITTVSQESVLSGVMGVTEWFYTKFFISQLLGITL